MAKRIFKPNNLSPLSKDNHSYNPKYLLGALSILVGSLFVSCNKQPTHSTSEASSSKTQTTLEKVDLIPAPKPTTSSPYHIADALDQSTLDALYHAAETNPDIQTIISNLQLYPNSLIELAAYKPETVEFVMNYLEYENVDWSKKEISVVSDYKDNEIPLFIQWDNRWGYQMYGDDFIAVNGCGPTCLSMVIVGLTGDTSINPKVIADFSYASGYLEGDYGTSWSLMTDGAAEFGINSRDLPLLAGSIRNALKAGRPIIASMKPGHFTRQGHFLVLTGINEDDQVTINDPDSIIRSNELWDLELILNESKNLWVFEVAEN